MHARRWPLSWSESIQSLSGSHARQRRSVDARAGDKWWHNSPALSLWIVPTTRVGVSRPEFRRADVHCLKSGVLIYDHQRVAAPSVDGREDRAGQIDMNETPWVRWCVNISGV
eukprot:2817986-Pleurochrysis_carterae.AAC.4